MSKHDISMSLGNRGRMNFWERIAIVMLSLGVMSMLAAFLGKGNKHLMPFLVGLVSLVIGGILFERKRNKFKNLSLLIFSVGLISLSFLIFKLDIQARIWLIWMLGFTIFGALLYFYQRFGKGLPGIKNNGIFQSETTRPSGTISWFLTITFTGFYIMLYWFPGYLHGLIYATEPFFQWFIGKPAIYYAQDGSIVGYNQWYLYGFIYTLAVLLMGTRFIFKYRHNRYQKIRTVSVMFFQLVIAFLLPGILAKLNAQGWQTESFYFSYFWPLDYDALFPSNLNHMITLGFFGKFVIYWMIIGAFVAIPIMTYFFGKRWYCSWVCGCGGLAETVGDPFRQLSNKSLKAWQIERITIYSVLALITLITILLLSNWRWDFLTEDFAHALKKGYGFGISSIFAGVIGTGFYPILGNRVWCRFGCPQAAVLGILQKYFSRFKITTNGAQCISCGNCSTYCEMGIDVKYYAQRGQNIVRASCVCCGVCSAVWPRGVLKLENGPVQNRTTFSLDHASIDLFD